VQTREGGAKPLPERLLVRRVQLPVCGWSERREHRPLEGAEDLLEARRRIDRKSLSQAPFDGRGYWRVGSALEQLADERSPDADLGRHVRRFRDAGRHHALPETPSDCGRELVGNIERFSGPRAQTSTDMGVDDVPASGARPAFGPVALPRHRYCSCQSASVVPRVSFLSEVCSTASRGRPCSLDRAVPHPALHLTFGPPELAAPIPL
jgi:hypothetical protein